MCNEQMHCMYMDGCFWRYLNNIYLAKTQNGTKNLDLFSPKQDQDGRGGGSDEEDTNGKLTDEDKLACAQVVQEYIAGRVTDPVVAGKLTLHTMTV